MKKIASKNGARTTRHPYAKKVEREIKSGLHK